jgi:tripartite-type tricarboxylate transporter receptor subunit TctC
MLKKLAVITGALLLVLALVAPGCTPESDSVTPAEFYQGKAIDFVATHSPGIFHDLAARIIANYLSEDTGANVNVTTRDGAGGLEGMNYVYRSKPDGLTMGTVTTVKFISNKVLGEPAAVYELDKFSYIMSAGHQPYCFMVSPEGLYQSVADLQAGTDLKIGGSSPSGPVSLGGLFLIKLLGLDARVVTGIGAEEERALAVERGEIIGYFMNIPNARAGIETGMIKPMFMLTTERGTYAPDVPAITELVDLSDEDLALVELWETTFISSVLFTASPDIPADRLDFLRELAGQWTEDEAFRDEVNQAAGYEVENYLAGEEVSQAMLNMAAALDQFQAIFTDLIEQYRA